MRIAMIGSGYVGLVSGACFADFGHTVTCVDKDERKINALLQGEIPIYEPGLDVLVNGNRFAGRLSFTTDLSSAMKDVDAVFIAVGTPTRRGDGHADLSYVYAAAEEIAALLSRYTVIVTKSTVPVGTADEVEAIIRRVAPEADFSVASNPEFLREGAAIDDFKRPDRVVVGADDERAREVLRKLYRPLNLNETPIMFTNRRTAELIKYAANAFLATKITFINEMADICEKTGANVQDVARGIGLDRRIGSKFLHAGPGYGGSCFPKDTMALVRTAEQYQAPTRIVEAVVEANAARKKRMVDKIESACGGSVKGKTIAILGLAFKPETDDMRDAPSLDIVPGLIDRGATVQAHDPQSIKEAKHLLPDSVIYCDDPYLTAKDADAVVIITEWNEYRALNIERLGKALRRRVMIDLRNIYKSEEIVPLGFDYTSVGR
ncbi:UDP-glucose 6-dehydrogenase [Parvibaculum lavamentivorans DS-1]|uniref:UDP-glucose 6-dehydrogenase n=1 Tax=Parvibaculum lavamentivorans (strain DS-1 / DSM 13023 / NCIMB 13966) TaxID=402881 RepID=A7HUF3_PARL1|nr:UDP-glucose/GDP-mannose dehydrogenase family protein [Parvibaculum lavamentivorans]ABS63536.1 UDP-glucose 6-dehydrogenase [Parvibaculum lavamentivorans DS-1]